MSTLLPYHQGLGPDSLSCICNHIEDPLIERTLVNLSLVDKTSNQAVNRFLELRWSYLWEGTSLKSKFTPFWQRVFSEIKLNLEGQLGINLPAARYRKLRAELYNYGEKVPRALFLMEGSDFQRILEEIADKNDSALRAVWEKISPLLNSAFLLKSGAPSSNLDGISIDEIRGWIHLNKDRGWIDFKEKTKKHKKNIGIKIGSLDLSKRSLKVIPHEVADLPIEKLLLFGNKIKVIPPQLGDMKTLQVLSLGENEITRIPEFFADSSKLKTLKTLILRANHITYISNNLLRFFKNKDLQFRVGENPLSVVFDPFSSEESDSGSEESTDDIPFTDTGTLTASSGGPTTLTASSGSGYLEDDEISLSSLLKKNSACEEHSCISPLSRFYQLLIVGDRNNPEAIGEAFLKLKQKDKESIRNILVPDWEKTFLFCANTPDWEKDAISADNPLQLHGGWHSIFNDHIFHQVISAVKEVVEENFQRLSDKDRNRVLEEICIIIEKDPEQLSRGKRRRLAKNNILLFIDGLNKVEEEGSTTIV